MQSTVWCMYLTRCFIGTGSELRQPCSCPSMGSCPLGLESSIAFAERTSARGGGKLGSLSRKVRRCELRDDTAFFFCRLSTQQSAPIRPNYSLGSVWRPSCSNLNDDLRCAIAGAEAGAAVEERTGMLPSCLSSYGRSSTLAMRLQSIRGGQEACLQSAGGRKNGKEPATVGGAEAVQHQGAGTTGNSSTSAAGQKRFSAIHTLTPLICSLCDLIMNILWLATV